MNQKIILAAAALAVATLNLRAQVTLTTQHVDVGIAYESGAWDLHVHDETNDQEYEPGEAILFAGTQSSNGVPANPQFSFLGSPGAPVWILPQNQDANLLLLGIGAEELDNTTFLNDLVTLSLVSVSGPGHFALYQTDGFGTPTVFMNTRDGITAADEYEITAGNHAHFNWAFSEMGTYTITFDASGILDNGLNTPTSSGPVDYTFQIVPEPGTYALVGVGLLALGISVRRRIAWN